MCVFMLPAPAGEIIKFETGDKDRCSVFDDIQISCMAGICKNYSAVYR